MINNGNKNRNIYNGFRWYSVVPVINAGETDSEIKGKVQVTNTI